MQVPQSFFYNPTFDHSWIDESNLSGTFDNLTYYARIDNDEDYIAYSCVNINNIDYSKFKVVKNDSEIFVNSGEGYMSISVTEPLYNNAETYFGFQKDQNLVIFHLNNSFEPSLPIGYTCNYKLYYDNQLLANINMTTIDG